MKRFLIFLAVYLSLVVTALSQTQGTALRAINGVGTNTVIINTAHTKSLTNSAQGFGINIAPKVNFDFSVSDGIYAEPNLAGASFDGQGGGIFGGGLEILTGGTLGIANKWRVSGESLGNVVFDTSTSAAITNIASGGFQPTNINLGFIAGNPPTLVLKNRTNGPANLSVIGTYFGDGSGLTNLPPGSSSNLVSIAPGPGIDVTTNTTISFTIGLSPTYFDSIPDMVGSPVTNLPAVVQSYWGTNNAYGEKRGGGTFQWEDGTATTNLGTVFPAAGGGRWRRVFPVPGRYQYDWWPIQPITTLANIHDDSLSWTNMLSTVPNNSTIVIPNFTTAYGTNNFATNGTPISLLVSNRYGLTFIGESDLKGTKLSFGNRAPVLAYLGANGGTLMSWQDSQFITMRGIGLSATTPCSIESDVTNHANACLDIDQTKYPPSPPQISTANTIDGNYFYSNTETNWQFVAVYLARNCLENNEGMIFNDNSFGGGTATPPSTNNGVGIKIGPSANVLQTYINRSSYYRCSKNVYDLNGGVHISAALGTDASVAYDINSWQDTFVLSDIRGEHDEQFARIGGGTTPFVIRDNYIATDSAASLSGTNPVISVDGSLPLLTLVNNAIEPDTSGSGFAVKMFDVNDIYSANILSLGNKYPSTSAWTNMAQEFVQGVSLNEFDGVYGQIVAWSGDGGVLSTVDRQAKAASPSLAHRWLVNVLNPSSGVNIMQLSRSDGRVYIGTNGNSILSTEKITGFGALPVYFGSSVYVTNSASPFIKIADTDSGSGASDGFDFQMSGTDAYLWNYENGGVHFASGNVERMTIQASGQVDVLGSLSAGGIFYGDASGVSNAISLVAGANITLTPTDTRTISIASSGGGSPFTGTVTNAIDSTNVTITGPLQIYNTSDRTNGSYHYAGGQIHSNANGSVTLAGGAITGAIANNSPSGTPGLKLTNITTATSGNPKASPMIQFDANGYNTTGSTNSTVHFTVGTTATSAATAAGRFSISNSVGAGAATEVFGISSAGAANISGSLAVASLAVASGATANTLTSSGDVIAGANSYFYWLGRSVMGSPADGRIRFANNANNVGAQLEAGSAIFTNGIIWQGGAQLTNIYTAAATLDFGNAATIGCSDLTITVTGAALGDVVDLGVPNASIVANSSYSAWVSSADTVTVRFCALISGDPASGVFRAEVHKWK